jgi:hypothetical protein
MITWNYRVFRETNGDYIIREVFYAEDGTIIGCTADAVEPFGSTLEELTASIADFQAALALPVLTLADMPQAAMTQNKTAKRQTLSSADVRARLGLSTYQTPKRKQHN